MTTSSRPPEAGVVPSGRPGGWLAERWIGGLHGADPAGLARGRTWARGGRVRDFEVTPGLATATVLDGDPFGVSIRVEPWESAEWRRFAEVLRTRLAWIAALLEGELPPALVTQLDEAGVRLLPRRRELDQSCDCDDWNAVCPHVGAVHAVLADALDGDPFLLLTLRGRGREQVLSELHVAWGASDPPEVIDDGAIPAGDWYTSPRPLDLKFEFGASVVAAAGLKSMGAPPGGADLVRGLAPLYEAGAKAALEIALREVAEIPTSSGDDAPSPVLRDDIDEEELTELLVDRLSEHPGAKSQALAEALGLPMLRVRAELVELEKLGIVYRTGNTRGTRWWVG